MSIWLKITTYWRLGFLNLVRVALYRIALKLGIHPVTKVQSELISGVFFEAVNPSALKDLAGNSGWVDGYQFFGIKVAASDKPPNWHKNCVSGETIDNPLRPWWQLSDFDLNVGDIKTVWEASRFDWVVGLAQSACNGNSASLHKLNTWLNDWIENNPSYLGANWKCGQESSIRVMHLAMASLITQQHDVMTPQLRALVVAHLRRIAPTIGYAVGQDNNHGTSEAAALFIGGSWLVLNGSSEGARWESIGRKWLEDRASKLIQVDGSFSQHSVNYHRVMLDTYSMAEVWRQKLGLSAFSPNLNGRLGKAVDWLHAMPGIEFGHAVNLGANDGARLLPLTDTDYRDFRPTLQLASVLFNKKRAITLSGIWDLQLGWLGIDLPALALDQPKSRDFDCGGYAVFRQKEVSLLLRYPRYKFRPSQSDALHLDLWVGGLNVLRDAGTYSYNVNSDVSEYFNGVEGHNTVQFDQRDQMPRLSRFLLSSWLKTDYFEPLAEVGDSINISAGYTDHWGASHRRSVELSKKKLVVKDLVSGFEKSACLRWRLPLDNWSLENNTITNGKIRIVISSDIGDLQLRIIEGTESIYYLKKQPITVVEARTKSHCQITTELYF